MHGWGGVGYDSAAGYPLNHPQHGFHGNFCFTRVDNGLDVVVLITMYADDAVGAAGARGQPSINQTGLHWQFTGTSVHDDADQQDD